ncbi:endonuclease/exonuclease/phosphatase family protein [candidate division CSSED10-310 bacterium]|uniref:Endonuclease/exonuclease/phosphatase family protein n=1 Tax=candidate division CSSED10-310 bacterium TaxID=2855610 RepID=A0ABV6YSU0_UNCC1
MFLLSFWTIAGLNRPPLAQTFEQLQNGEYFTVVVNHFKSKSCSGASGLDKDQGDGQGCWNQTRLEATRDLMQWLTTDPTQSNDEDYLIIGDLNAYPVEDPITAFQNSGYVDLVNLFFSADYTFIYEGQSGRLDYAIASPTLVDQVNNITVWHINADEPPIFDYNVEYKSAQQINDFYNSDHFRSSDHDPLVLGLNL